MVNHLKARLLFSQVVDGGEIGQKVEVRPGVLFEQAKTFQQAFSGYDDCDLATNKMGVENFPGHSLTKILIYGTPLIH